MTQIKEEDDASRTLNVRLKEIESTEPALEATLTATPERKVVWLRGNYNAVYIRTVADLDHRLSPVTDSPPIRPISPLIDKIVVQPGNSRGDKRQPIQLPDDLFRMLEFAARTQTQQSPGPRRPGLR